MSDATPSDMLRVEWHKVAKEGDIAEGTSKAFSIAGVGLVVTHVGERYGAISSRCAHAGGPLMDATLENGRLVCPWHGREYDPLTGACDGYAESVRAYPVELRADGIYVAV